MAPKILVVDDEPDLEILIRQRFRKQIREDLLRFEFAANGVQALKRLAEHPDISLVLSDINMPGVKPADFLRGIRRRFPHVVVIIITGYASIETAITALKNGAFDYITKPIQPNRILDVAKGLLNIV